MKGRSHAYCQAHGEDDLFREAVEVAAHLNAYLLVVGVVVCDHPQIHLATDGEVNLGA